MRSVVLDLATALREEVTPELGRHAGREHSGAGAGGDITFAIDERAEAFMERFLAERAPQVAFYSEDRGMVLPAGSAQWVLVVDPIDGTRPAMAGFEAACVSVALAPLDDGEPTIGDVRVACIVEIKSGQAFVAERGKGVDPAPALSANTELSRMFWAYGLRGRPVRRIAEVVGELVDSSSVGGGTFDLGSATYDMTRIVTGQLDAYIEPGPRIIADVPGMRQEFERIGGGVVLNNSPYDLAAAVLICEEAGAVVSDAYGESLGSRPMLGSGVDFQLSCVTAATPELHARIIAELDAGIERLIRTLA
ncbi:MAG TPA: inositol monophosphatase family protein [Solirubrobacterales bacterium]|nr:inositol monophosphatase family protein [Solirubrobacterales bacterium]